MANKLGETKYYKTPAGGSYGLTAAGLPSWSAPREERVSKEFEYVSSPWAGNIPHGQTPISKEEYIGGLQYGAKYGAKEYEKTLRDVQAEGGIYAKGYIDPIFQKFQPTAPTPTEEYFTPEYKAQLETEREGMVNIGTAQAPLYVPKGSAAHQQITQPTTVATSDQLRAEQADESLPYVKYADSEKVFDREGQHITAERAAEIPDFWKQVQMKGEPRPEGVATPIESIQSVFGAEWQPAAAFTPEIQAQGVYGAVKVGDKVFTLGPGGSEMSPESYKAMFGREITDTTGIAGDVDIETALRLGITVDADTILDPIKPIDPFEQWTKFKEEGNEDVIALQTKLNDAVKTLMDKMTDFGETKAEAKEEEADRLEMEEKSQAIADAQTAANDLQAAYALARENERFRHRKSSQILGRQAKLDSLEAVQLAPMLISIQIAQGNWDRAKEMLDDWSDDYNEAMNMQMQAAQMNIDMITGELNREQTEQLEDAKIKFDMWQADENRRLETQEEVKKMMMMYNGQGAGININDNWDTAYKKASAYIEDELQFERDMKDLDKKLKEKSLRATTGTTYAPSPLMKLYNELGGQAGTGQTFNEFEKERSSTGDTGVVMLEDIFKGTADYLVKLRDSGQLNDENYRHYIQLAMRDAGYDPTIRTDYDWFVHQTNTLMGGGNNSGSNSSVASNSFSGSSFLAGSPNI